MTARIAVFIDAAYIEKICQKEFSNVWVDYALLSQAMAEGCSHLRTYYYHCLPYQSHPPTEDERKRFAKRQRFYTTLDKIDRFEVRLGSLKHRGLDASGNPIFEQKGVDVYMAIDLVQLASKHLITHAALLTADNDFTPAIQAAKNEGVVIRLYHSPTLGHTHDLWQTADERHIINTSFINRVERQQFLGQ